MGRIKITEIKKASWELFERYPKRFTDNFVENKKQLEEFVENKKTRNKIAGHLVRVVKQN